MALKPLNPHANPYGTFDGLDSEVGSLLGGEVVRLTYVTAVGSGATDKAASDEFDGYVSNTAKNRPAVTLALSAGKRPLFLADEGIANYGTLFGVVVGGTAGQSVSGTQLGPHTALASGKVTLWDGPGMYAVTLDAVDTNATTGLQKTNTSLAGGDALYATAAGKLTPTVGSAFESIVVGRFIEFTTNGSYVNTPADLVTGTSGNFTQAVLRFMVET